MTRRLFLTTVLSFSITTNLLAYKDMTKQSRRARDLNMRTKDYINNMALAGTLTGFMFGLFLWKIR